MSQILRASSAFLVNISLPLFFFVSTGSPCCKAARWNTFTLIVFYFITSESGALLSVYRTGGLLGTVAVVADGWA